MIDIVDSIRPVHCPVKNDVHGDPDQKKEISVSSFSFGVSRLPSFFIHRMGFSPTKSHPACYWGLPYLCQSPSMGSKLFGRSPRSQSVRGPFAAAHKKTMFDGMTSQGSATLIQILIMILIYINYKLIKIISDSSNIDTNYECQSMLIDVDRS